jgi:hypothetical protein
MARLLGLDQSLRCILGDLYRLLNRTPLGDQPLHLFGGRQIASFRQFLDVQIYNALHQDYPRFRS